MEKQTLLNLDIFYILTPFRQLFNLTRDKFELPLIKKKVIMMIIKSFIMVKLTMSIFMSCESIKSNKLKEESGQVENSEISEMFFFFDIHIKIYNIRYILLYFLIITIRQYRDDTKRSEITRLPRGHMKQNEDNTRNFTQETTRQRKTWMNNIQVNTTLSYEFR